MTPRGVMQCCAEGENVNASTRCHRHRCHAKNPHRVDVGAIIEPMPTTMRAFQQLGDAITRTLARRFPGTRWRITSPHAPIDRAEHRDAPPPPVGADVADNETVGGVGIVDGVDIDAVAHVIAPSGRGVHRDHRKPR